MKTSLKCGKVFIDNEFPSRLLTVDFEGVRQLTDEKGIRCSASRRKIRSCTRNCNSICFFETATVSAQKEMGRLKESVEKPGDLP